MERRTTTGAECRIKTREDGTKVATGYGAVFFDERDAGTEYQLGRSVVERIGRDAFTDALSRPDDVRGLFNHQPDHILGRTTAGTTRLSVDEKGLKYEIDLPDTQIGRDVATSIERGDLTGSSFAFTVGDGDTEWIEEEGRDIRVIKSVRQLFDVGPVTYPAYESATTALRAEGDAEEAIKERDLWKQGNAEIARNRLAKQARARAVDIG